MARAILFLPSLLLLLVGAGFVAAAAMLASIGLRAVRAGEWAGDV